MWLIYKALCQYSAEVKFHTLYCIFPFRERRRLFNKWVQEEAG